MGRTVDGGRSWRFRSGILSPHPSAAGTRLEAVHFFDARRGVVAADGGKICVTSDGGENWGEVRPWTGNTAYLFDLDFLDEQTGWAAGLGGVVKTADGGQTWVLQSKQTGRAIEFVDAQRGWIVGQHAVAMSSDDGGTTWVQATLPLQQGERPDFWDVYFLDAQQGWIAGDEGTLLHTRDGGRSWVRRGLGIAGARSAPKLERIPRDGTVEAIDAGDRTPGLTLAAIRFAGAQHGWIVGFFANMGRSLILRTTDGGATWSVDADIEGEELRCLFALDRQRVWAVGARTRPGAQAIYFRDPAAK